MLLALPAAVEVSVDRIAVQLEMKNVHLHVDDGIVLEVTRRGGTMVSRDEKTPPVFDDPKVCTSCTSDWKKCRWTWPASRI